MLNRKRVLYGDGSPATNSEIMSDRAGNKHRKMGVTSVNGVSPVQLDVEVVEIAGSDEENDLVGGGRATSRSQLPPSHSGGQRNIHAFLKAEVAKLCKALKLSEDVVHLIQILLEYLVENYDVKKGGIRHIQAFQMSLCWIAMDILGRKIDRRGSLLEAKKILNFECHLDLANSVYEKLTSLKETFQKLHGKTNDPISSRNVVSPLADIAGRSSNLLEPCVKAEVIEILDQEENQESRDKIDVVENRKKLRKAQKYCEKKKWRRRRKHEKKVQEFNKLWKEKRQKLMEEHKAELAVFSAIHSPSATKMDKFIEESTRFCAAIQDLECSMEWERRVLEKKHAAEMEELNRKCEKWLAKAEANYGSGGSTMINDANAHELESRNDNQVSKNSGSNLSAPLIIIASDAVALDLSTNVEIEVVGCGFPTDNEPVDIQVAIPLSDDQPDADNISLQNPEDFAAAKVDSNGPVVIEIPSTNKDTEMDSVILGSHGGPLPENVIVNEIPSANGDTKGDSVCRGGSLPVDAPSTVGKDLADCLKPADLQTPNATDNGTTEEHSVPCPDTVVSPHEHGDSAGFHNQPVALNGEHTMLHVSDDCRSRTDLQEASVSESQVDREQSDTCVNIADSADCNSRLDSHTTEEPDKAGAQVQNLVSPTQVDEKAGELNKLPVLENGEDSMLLSSDNAIETVESHDHPNLPTVCGTGVEPGDKPLDSSQNRTLSDVAGNAAELQNAAVLPNSSNLVSADCNSRPDSHITEEPDNILAGEQPAGAQAQNLVSPTQVDEDAGELNKQPALENGEDNMLLSSDNGIDIVESYDHPNLPTVSGTGVEANESLDSSQNHTLSDVAGNTAELQNAAVLPNSSNLVSAETSSHAHPDLPPVSGIDHEPIGERFVGFLNPESISEVAANAVLPLPPHPHFAWLTNKWLLAEPLQRELIKRCNEKEQFDKLHEETKSQLNASCEKEIQEMYAQMRDKYTKKLRDAESSFTVKKTEIEAKLNKLVTNRFLANAFRSKCRYFISSGSSDVVQPGAPSSHLQQQHFVSSSQSSIRQSPVASSSTVNPVASSGFMQQHQLLSSQPSLRPSVVVASSSSLSQPASVHPVYPVQGYPIASLSSPQPPIIQQTNTPSAQFTPRSTNPSLTHSRPLQISTVTPNIGNARVGGSNVRAPAPHLQPFRPPPSPVHPMTTSPTASQPVRLGTNQNALNRWRTSEGQNDGQPGPPRNNYSFSAVELPRTGNVNVSNAQTLGCTATSSLASDMICLSDDDENQMI